MVNTYRELLERLQELDDNQLDCNMAIELLNYTECFSSTTGDFDFTIARNDDFLDDGHPVFILRN